jgi:hypothetical protein
MADRGDFQPYSLLYQTRFQLLGRNLLKKYPKIVTLNFGVVGTITL